MTQVELNNRIGKRIGKDMGKVRKAVTNMSPEKVNEFLLSGSVSVEGHTLSGDDLRVKSEFKGDTKIYEAVVSTDGSVMVAIDVRRDAKVVQEKIAREFMNRVQKLRKKANLNMMDKIQIYFNDKGTILVPNAK